MGILGFGGVILVLAYQNENHQGARELAATRAALVAQVGTDQLMDRVPEVVPESENFYAIPEVQRWRTAYSTYFGRGVVCLNQASACQRCWMCQGIPNWIWPGG